MFVFLLLLSVYAMKNKADLAAAAAAAAAAADDDDDDDYDDHSTLQIYTWYNGLH